jgi:hypothetical protein
LENSTERDNIYDDTEMVVERLICKDIELDEDRLYRWAFVMVKLSLRFN